MLSNITDPKSICILRLSAIGDVCHTIATVQAIQARWPQAKLTWIIGKVEAQLVKELSNIEFIIFDKKAGFNSYRLLWQQLTGRHFDILLHMQVALRASLASLCIRATERWGFDRRRAKEGQWLFTNRQIAAQHHPHVADGFWGFAKAIGIDEDKSPKWEMPLAKKEGLWCEQHINSDQSYIVISPAASKVQRNWLADRYAEIANHAHEKGYQIILSGAATKMEHQLGKEIIDACAFPVKDLIGKTTLGQLLSLMAKAELVIAPDSGPAHMATIVNTPVVGLYAHSNPERTGPYHSLATTVSVYEQLLIQQTGKSIANNPWGKRVKGEDLMSLISTHSVIAAVERCIDNIHSDSNQTSS